MRTSPAPQLPPRATLAPAFLPGWPRLRKAYPAAPQLLPVLLLYLSFQGITPVPQTPPSISFQITACSTATGLCVASYLPNSHLLGVWEGGRGILSAVSPTDPKTVIQG